jgi:hypothetical protein
MTPEKHLAFAEAMRDTLGTSIEGIKKEFEAGQPTDSRALVLILSHQATIMAAMGNLIGCVQHILEGPHEE